MNTTIFRLGLRQSLVPSLSVVAAIVATLSVAEWLARRASGDSSLDLVFTLLWAPFLLWSGFLAGGRPFSREFRERHFLLLHALPVERHVAWASLALGALTAGVSSLVLATLLRPALLTAWRSEPSRGLSGAAVAAILLVFYLILFAAGSCYALLLDGTAFHAVGFVATFATLAESGVLFAALVQDPRADWAGNPAMAHGLVFPDLIRETVPADVGGLACATLLFLLYAGFSLAFFVRGEFPAARVRWGNGAGLVAGHLAFFVAAGAALEARARTRPFVLEDTGLVLSPDGKYLAVAERREGYPRFARVQVIDTSTGHRLGSTDVDGLRSLTWSADPAQLLAAASDVSPWRRLGYLRTPSDAVVRFTLEGKILGLERFDSSRILMGPWLVGDSPVVVLRSGTLRRIVALGNGGASKELLQVPDTGQFWLLHLSDGPGILAAGFEKGPVRAWLLGPRVEELVVGGGVTSAAPPQVLGRAVVTVGGASAELARRFPLPSGVQSGPGGPRYVSWAFADRPPWVFAFVPLGDGKAEALHARNPAGGAWRVLVRDLPRSPRQPADQESLQYGWCAAEGVSLGRRLWLCHDGVVVDADADRCEVVVHDLRAGRQYLLQHSPQEDVSVSSLPGGALAISFRSLQCLAMKKEVVVSRRLTTALRDELAKHGRGGEAAFLRKVSPGCQSDSATGPAPTRNRVFLLPTGGQGPEEHSLRCEQEDDPIGAPVGVLGDGGFVYFTTPWPPWALDPGERVYIQPQPPHEGSQALPAAPLRVSQLLVARRERSDVRIWPPGER